MLVFVAVDCPTMSIYTTRPDDDGNLTPYCVRPAPQELDWAAGAGKVTPICLPVSSARLQGANVPAIKALRSNNAPGKYLPT